MRPEDIMGSINAGYEAEVLKALRTLSSEVNDLSRKTTELQINIVAIRRKLGFDVKWAEEQHDQDYIDVLQEKLRLKKERLT